MEKTDKSAEDFFKAEVDRQWRERTSAFSSDPGSLSRIPYIIYPAIYKIMESYVAQQLSEYKEVIKELLPANEWQLKSTINYLKDFGETVQSEPDKFNKCDQLKSIIDRAKKLIEK